MQLAEPDKTVKVQGNHVERRKFTRFVPKDGTMAVNSHALGPVVDISMGGLSFRYSNDKTENAMTDLFGIFLGSDDFLIEKIESRLITDTAVDQDS